MRESLERAFEVYGEPINNVSDFKYLGRVLTAGDDNWLATVGNLGKARKSWGRLSSVLLPTGPEPETTAPNSSAPSPGCRPSQASCRRPQSTLSPDI